ncbi:hypothetical protein [Bradyrhizobium niftali]|uniref:Uncharacterized protein n=1 Tax=Bradyrhizobium niftali TaxID=2560055 RepID=A0A4Y9LEJ8_9BRAD|nr:hypothetical protein [Bradyrhizobium niftali]TFV41349.1 hypothetical protein E4K65_36250 [Bradyrhizobium niftali]
MSTALAPARQSRSKSHRTAVAGNPIMLCFQKPARTITNKADTGEGPDRSRARNQTNPARSLARQFADRSRPRSASHCARHDRDEPQAADDTRQQWAGQDPHGQRDLYREREKPNNRKRPSDEETISEKTSERTHDEE